MISIQLTGTWSFTGSFHAGSGLSGNGADRCIRAREKWRTLGAANDIGLVDDVESGDAKYRRVVTPEISGDAVKGAIRGSAERIVRWLIHPHPLEEQEDNSIPRHPALKRIFASQQLPRNPGSLPRLYRFGAPRYIDGGSPRATASTAINPDRGVARENTLRVIEHWSANAAFEVNIAGRGGTWDEADSQDYLDLVLLVAAFAATSQVGGKKGNGWGETALAFLSLEPGPLPLCDANALTSLQVSLLAEKDYDA